VYRLFIACVPAASTAQAGELLVPPQHVIGSVTSELSLSEAGSLIATSMNESMGRTRWLTKLTLAYRNERFVVAGSTHSQRDTIELENDAAWDVNFLSRKGEASRGEDPVKPFTLSGPAPAAEDWSDELVPKECR
jgi:hypothetical protein